jgi:monoamine oxidase
MSSRKRRSASDPLAPGAWAPTRRQLLTVAAAAGVRFALAGPLARVAHAAGTASYDDGSGSIPLGLVGEPERVIVVGAGWAGLTATNALRNAGVEHIVLEGRDRIGGRAHTVNLDGVPVDLGCSWIHDPIGNPMTSFAEQAGVLHRDANLDLDALTYRMWDGRLDRELSQAEKIPALGHGATFVFAEAAALADELGSGASVYDGAQIYLDRHGVSGDARRQAEWAIRVLSELPENYPWTKISLYHSANRDLGYAGGLGVWPVGGYQELYRAMAGSLPVRLRQRVYAIERRSRGVTVHAVAHDRSGARRISYRGSHVLVTVPLGVLKSGAIRFDPPLPASKRASIARVGFGRIEKIAMRFDEPFWADALHTHIVHISDPIPFRLPLWVDVDRISGHPALVAFSAGSDAKRIHALGARATLELALARLRDILGHDVPRPRAWRVTNWQGSPYTRGGYTTTALGASPDDLDTLAEPVAGRILFGGEHTHRTRYAHADGAMTTGIREAKRLLGSALVTLSAG